MKVGDKGGTNQPGAVEREGQKRQREAQGDKQRNFSDLLDGQRTATGERPGDERGRMLREGEVQRQGRDEGALRQSRRDDIGEDKRSSPGSEKSDAREPGEVSQNSRSQGQSSGQSQGMGEGAAASRQAGANEGQATQSERAVGEPQSAMRSLSEAENARLASQNTAIDEVARQVLNAVGVGEDAQARRVVFLDVTVAGQGDVRIRLRRDGGGMEVRMRADNDHLARSLRQGVDELRQRGSEAGVEMTSIQVVR